MITKIIAEEKIQLVKKKIEESREVVIVTHLSPDGDAVGSSLALAHFLNFLEKKVTVIVPNAYPDNLKWMPGIGQIFNYQEKKAFVDGVIAGADLLFALDFNTLSRVGDLAASVGDSAAHKVMVDHHPEPGHFADTIVSYPQIASTSEMVFRLICRMGYFTDISKECAECIYTGMMTDTGAFTFNSNNPEIYNIVSELIKKGINKDQIYNNIYNNFTADRFRLMGYALSEKMKIYPEFKTALITLSLNELNKFHYKTGDTEGFVNLPLSIEGIVFSVFIKEDTDKVKMSFRSRGTFPANNVASAHFGGGGHLNAAGGESHLTLAETIEKFESILPSYKEILNNV